eukprot:433074_1
MAQQNQQQRQPQGWQPQHSGGGSSQPSYVQTQQQQVVYEEKRGYTVGTNCNQWNSLDNREKCKRNVYYEMSIVCCHVYTQLLALAEDNTNANEYSHCGWTKVHGGGYRAGWRHGDYSYMEVCEGDAIGCAALGGGIVSILTLLIAFVVCVFAVVWVNPFCIVPTRCGSGDYLRMFKITLVLVVIALIAWLALGSAYCMGEDYVGGGIGPSLVMEMFAIIVLVIILVVLCAL